MKISVNTFVSLDGVMQGPGAAEEDPSGGFTHGGWLVPFGDANWGRIVDGWYGRADAVLLGRTTFELMKSYWPRVTDPDNVVGVALNTLPKYVVTSTLADTDLSWGDTIALRGNAVEAVRALKALDGGELQVHGSWSLIQTLHQAGLINTYRFLQFPVVVGHGKRLFADPTIPATLKVTTSELLDGGVLALEADVVAYNTIAVDDFVTPVDGHEVTHR